jgi:cytochrome c peroxidase
MNTHFKRWRTVGLAAAVLGATAVSADSVQAFFHRQELRAAYDGSLRFTDAVTFPEHVAVGPGADPARGQAAFGLAADDVTQDSSHALVEGHSIVEGQTVVSNGKTCATCHHPEFSYGLPPLPLHNTIPSSNTVFWNLAPEDGPDPLAHDMFDQHGLIVSRVGRFNPLLDPSDPFRKAIAWRKTQRLVNVGLTHSLLTDGRAREMIEQARGAVFNHTQDSDVRFDDLANAGTRLRDIAAYQEGLLSQPELAALYDPLSADYAALVADPFATVNPQTQDEVKGQKVFQQYCFSCHSMPNVFGNREHIDGPPLGYPPAYGHLFDVGVAQRNALGLEFRRWDPATQTRVPVVLPLARQDGALIPWTITDDIGLAASTGRIEDLHRFKVPQLRRIKDLGPYFHDNSAATLEEVVDYFNSDWYNNSEDGAQYPIHLNDDERAELLAFLRIL